MSIKQLIITALACYCIVASSCGNGNKQGLSGNIKGAPDNSYAILETSDDNLFWYPLDSAKIDSKGDFFIPYTTPSSPQLFRVRYGDKYVYLPIDSTEQLTLQTTAGSFDKNFTLSGSKLADGLTAFEREANRIEALANADSTEAFRQAVYAKYMADSKGDMLSYYILSRKVGDQYLIDYTHPFYAAVATNFQTYRPDDPHTAALVERAKQGQAERRKSKGYQNVVQAQQIALIDVELPDIKGVKHKLSHVAGKGKRTLLVLSSAESTDNPALNRTLRTIYENGSANIFEVYFDKDNLIFENGVKELPWTVVRDPDGLNSQLLLQYNVGALPTTFIYDSHGELTQRAATPEEIQKFLSQTK